jgi:hypothetical protein
MKFLRQIDDFLIDRAFEPLARLLDRWTGRSCLWFAGHFLCLAALVQMMQFSIAIDYWRSAHDPAYNNFIVLVIFAGPICIINQAIDYARLRQLHNDIENGSTGAATQHRFAPRKLRDRMISLLLTIDCFLCSAVMFFDWTGYEPGYRGIIITATAWLTALFLSYYFAACTPQPPRRRRVVNVVQSRA